LRVAFSVEIINIYGFGIIDNLANISLEKLSREYCFVSGYFFFSGEKKDTVDTGKKLEKEIPLNL